MENKENKVSLCKKNPTVWVVVFLFVLNMLVTSVASYFVYNKIMQNEYAKYGSQANYELMNKANKLQFEQQKEQIQKFVDENDKKDTTNTNTEEKKTENKVTKSDKPKVELFIMSYCPYGLQAQKGFLPMFRDFSKNADLSIKFVHYIMHGEKEAKENLVQYCIQKEQNDKYVAYQECFLKEEGKWEECKKVAKLDTKKLDSCVVKATKDFKVNEEIANAQKEGNNYPKFNVDAEASNKYGVQGSPTLVINGTIVEAGRSPKDYKDAICNAFNNQPEACKKEYSSQAFDPMFWFTANGQNNSAAAGCGQ